MRIVRMIKPKQFLQVQLLRSGAEQINAPHDACNALSRIVHYHGKLIRERLIRTTDKEISALVSQVLLIAPLHHILERIHGIWHV